MAESVEHKQTVESQLDELYALVTELHDVTDRIRVKAEAVLTTAKESASDPDTQSRPEHGGRPPGHPA